MDLARGAVARIHVFTATANDASGNTSVASAPSYGVTVHTAAPRITTFSTEASGALGADKAIDMTATVSKELRAGTAMRVTLSSGATVVLVSPARGTTVSGTYTVGEGDNTARPLVTRIDDSSIVDLAGNLLADKTLPAVNLDSQTIIRIDKKSPQIVSFAAGVPEGTYGAGSLIPVTATISESVQAGSTIEVSLSTGTPRALAFSRR